MHILEGKRMEEQIVTLPKDLDQMAEKVLKMPFDLRLLLLIDQCINSLTGAEPV
jgi:hypothetical protein